MTRSEEHDSAVQRLEAVLAAGPVEPALRRRHRHLDRARRSCRAPGRGRSGRSAGGLAPLGRRRELPRAQRRAVRAARREARGLGARSGVARPVPRATSAPDGSDSRLRVPTGLANPRAVVARNESGPRFAPATVHFCFPKRNRSGSGGAKPHLAPRDAHHQGGSASPWKWGGTRGSWALPRVSAPRT